MSRWSGDLRRYRACARRARQFGLGLAECTESQLADLTGLDAVYVSKLVRALERGGFVTRTVSPVDSRAVELSLTAHGRTAVREAALHVALRLLEAEAHG